MENLGSSEQPQGVSGRKLLAVGAFVLTAVLSYYTGQDVERAHHTGCPVQAVQSFTNPFQLFSATAANVIAEASYDNYPREYCDTGQ